MEGQKWFVKFVQKESDFVRDQISAQQRLITGNQ